MNINNTKGAEITISNISMMMSFMCFSRCKKVFEDLRLDSNAVYMVFRCKICVKYKYAMAPPKFLLCAYAHVFRKRPGYALIRACVLFRTNTVYQYYTKTRLVMKIFTDQYSSETIFPECFPLD